MASNGVKCVESSEKGGKGSRKSVKRHSATGRKGKGEERGVGKNYHGEAAPQPLPWCWL